MTLPFALHLGLPSGHESAAADLYWQAFGPKLNRLLGPEARALRMLAAGIRHDHAIAALDPNGRLIGIAGFRDPDGGLTDIVRTRPGLAARSSSVIHSVETG